MQNFCLSDAIKERFESAEEELGFSEKIVRLEPEKIDAWEFRDRKQIDYGDLNELAISIKNKGQCQPIVVVETSELFRPSDNNNADYVVIAGYRRWSACRKFTMQVKAVIRNYNFDEAVMALVSENEKENLSDCSRGFFYYSLLHKEKMNQEELSKKLGIAPAKLNQYLAFSQVPERVWIAVNNLSIVSAKTAATIRAIANKGEEYVDALVQIADKISKGYGSTRIKNEVDKYLVQVGKKQKKLIQKPYQFKQDGKTLFTLKNGKISFGKSLKDNQNFPTLISAIEKIVISFNKMNNNGS